MRKRLNRTNAVVRRRIALIGVAAILFQAILFGWHHHALAFSGTEPTASLSNASQPPLPASTEDLCEICSILHHQSAAPLAFVTPAIPSSFEMAIKPPAAVLPKLAAKSGFRARAPPLA
ncbi:MAG: hypothetical protein JO008_13225 [Alphaproteobacteria bacterium]|nr:hypothetical protein [Alphaproteobacteria bacterium]